jgi:hypothetical protein
MTSFIDNNLVFANPIATEDFMYIHNVMEPIIRESKGNSIYAKFRNLVDAGIFIFVGSGCNGVVVRYKNYAIKLYYAVAYETAGRDGEVLEKLQGSPYFPKLFYYYKKTYQVTEFIDGPPLGDNSVMENLDLSFIDNFLEALKFCDERHVEAADIGICDNIRVKDNKTPMFVDLGCFHIEQDFCQNVKVFQYMANNIRNNIEDRQKLIDAIKNETIIH